MTIIKLKKILDKTGYPVAYSHFVATEQNPAPDPPFIIYLVAYSSNLMADNKVFKKIDIAQVELYTKKKDLSVEKVLEDLFEQNDIPWDATDTWIESEKLYQRIYEIGVI
jgi:hypothetical protein